MQRDLENNNARFLTRGKSYQFKVKNIDLEFLNAYILLDPFGTNHILPLIDYSKYNFKVGQNIECEVVKINCSGKLFLEPKHPHYQEGKDYDFEVSQLRGDIQFRNGEKGMLIEVFDKLANKILVPTFSNWKEQKITLRVNKIHKGVPDLINTNISEKLFFRKYHSYKFEIDAIDRENDFFTLKDEYKNEYSISYSEYEHFNLQIGQEIICILKRNKPFEIILEPYNPFYQIGHFYEFTYMGTKMKSETKPNEDKIHYCIDKFGKEALINYRSQTMAGFPAVGSNIKCEVIRFKKGTLVLSY